MIITTLSIFGAGLLLLCVAWTIFCGYHIVREQASPVDESNKINKIRLLWFALTREGEFVTLFPWLLRDEWDNFKDKG